MRDIDFNLLPVFEALYEERGVGRAAVRLGVTQSAVSQALGRLRHALGDELFLRSARTLVPTAKAQQLAPVVRDLLSRWREACRPERFDPALSKREFRVVIGGYAGELLLPFVLSEIRKSSEGVRLRVWNMSSHVGEWLETGLVDIGVGTFDHLPKRFKSRPLFQHRYVWIARRGHAASAFTSLDEIMALPRMEITVGEGPLSKSGVWQAGGIQRRAMADMPTIVSRSVSEVAGESMSPVRFSVHHWRVACELVGKSDLVALVSERLAMMAVQEYGVTILSQYPPLVSSDLSLVWDGTQTSDPGNIWLRDLIEQAADQSIIRTSRTSI